MHHSFFIPKLINTKHKHTHISHIRLTDWLYAKQQLKYENRQLPVYSFDTQADHNNNFQTVCVWNDDVRNKSKREVYTYTPESGGRNERNGCVRLFLYLNIFLFCSIYCENGRGWESERERPREWKTDRLWKNSNAEPHTHTQTVF